MTKTYFLTGCAGFIGSNFVIYMLKKYKEDIRLINLDALTYAGNLENLASVSTDPRHIFIKGDIRDKATVKFVLKNISRAIVSDGEVYNIGGHNEKTNLFIVNKIIETLAEKTGDKDINTGLIPM